MCVISLPVFSLLCLLVIEVTALCWFVLIMWLQEISSQFFSSCDFNFCYKTEGNETDTFRTTDRSGSRLRPQPPSSPQPASTTTKCFTPASLNHLVVLGHCAFLLPPSPSSWLCILQALLKHLLAYELLSGILLLWIFLIGAPYHTVPTLNCNPGLICLTSSLDFNCQSAQTLVYWTL